MRVGSLFAGYGGSDLAVASVFPGAHPAWFVEFDKHPSTVLAHHWPDVPNYGDVTTVDWSAVEPVDILTGGYPCQPFSHAGKREGTNDDRHLFPYVADAIGVLRPGLVLLENVAGHLTLGGPEVIGALTGLGYDARWGVVRASDAGAPHRRARLFIVATADADVIGSAPAAQGAAIRRADELGTGRHQQRGLLPLGTCSRCGRCGPVAGDGPVWCADCSPHFTNFGNYDAAIRRWERITDRPAPSPTEPGRNGPRLNPAFVEHMMGLPAGHVTAVPGVPRTAQLKMLGNGIVPQQMVLALRLLLDDEAVVA